ncbi:Dbl homology domain-containing protein, partial [Dichotomocladium elegans]
ELVTTEETYLDHLTIIKRVFMDPMMEATTARLASVKDLQTIFAFIPQLLMLSTSLLRRLQNSDAIGKVFCEHLGYFDVYISYAAHFAKAQKCASKASSRSIVYRQLVVVSEIEKRMNRMGLPEYVIAPIQRVTRYCMLLKDLKKHSSPTHPDYPFIEGALKSLTALAHAMDTIQ